MTQAIEQALRLHQQGRLLEAEPLYREVLRKVPRDFQALHMLGVLAFQQGRAQEALAHISAALEVDPNSSSAHSNRGLALAALNRSAEALASYERALAIRPRDANALTNRGDSLCDLGRREEAIASYDRAIAINPRHVPALVNRGIALCDLGRLVDALASQDKALGIDPNDAAAWNNRGVALARLGRQGEALSSHDKALALVPDDLDALMNRGNAFLALKRPAEALASYARALVLRGDFVEAHIGRGHALFDLECYDDALASYDKALAIDPRNIDARFHRARTLAKVGRDADAIAVYRDLRESNANLPMLLNDHAVCLTNACQWSDTAALASELDAAVAHGPAVVDPFTLLRFDTTPAQQLACALKWLDYRRLAAVERDWSRAQFPAERIRVCYLSADFHRHATAHLIAELFELHDRARFEIIGVSFGPDDGSGMRARLVRSFDRFFDATTRSDEEVARQLRDLNVQIAVDLKGHTASARLGILAQRAAPVQATYLGYPATSGAAFIDYVIADRLVLPFEQQRFWTERIVHLPDSYQVNDSGRVIAAVPTRAQAGLAENGFVFCCFNNSWKLSARMFDVWMRLLRAVDGSVLWLYRTGALAADNLRREAAARSVDPARLVFAPQVDVADHLARLTLADLFLDTLPYNAHTTASDALWAGVPVLTCRGSTFAGRVATSLLDAAGLPELVTESLAAYEALALKLAREPELLEAIRSKLARQRTSCPLFDSRRFCRHIETAYRTMWDIRQRAEAPRSFAIDAN